MNILFATSEVVPFAKTGGLADVCGTLPLELAALGHQVAVIVPAYRGVANCGEPLEAMDITLEVPVGGKTIEGSLLVGRLPGSQVPVYFVRQDSYFDRQGIYGYEGSNLSVGMASVEDDGRAFEATAMEVGYVSDGWCLYADRVDEDGGDSPTSITVSHMMNTEYEVALRMEEDDDAANTSHMIAGLNWYQGGDGHNLKWQLNFTESESDNPANEGTRVDFGLVWRF